MMIFSLSLSTLATFCLRTRSSHHNAFTPNVQHGSFLCIFYSHILSQLSVRLIFSGFQKRCKSVLRHAHWGGGFSDFFSSQNDKILLIVIAVISDNPSFFWSTMSFHPHPGFERKRRHSRHNGGGFHGEGKWHRRGENRKESSFLNIARIANAVQVTIWMQITTHQCHDSSFAICQ